MEDNREESSIERLKKTLYSRNEKLFQKEKRTPLPSSEVDAPVNWGEPVKSFQFSPEDMKRKNNSFFNKFLVISFVLFIISLGVALFMFFGGVNMISSNNLDLKITAPSSISSGEELNIGLSILNGNRTDIENVVLIIDFPSGSQMVGEENKIITRDRVDLGVIEKGKGKEHTIRTLLFGEKDVVKTFIFKIEYRVKGSNAVFSKEKTYDVLIGSSPLLLNISYPKEVNSGQQIPISIEVTSNSSVPIKNTLVKIDYPYGFTYKSSSITPLSNNAVWNLGDLRDGDKKTLSLVGTLVGQNLEDRSFIISVGSQDPEIKSDIDTILTEETITLGIRKSFFDLSVTPLNNNAVFMGQAIPINIRWQNTLPDKILNTQVEVVLTGNALNRSSVAPGDNGYYRSSDNTIIWDKNTTNSLAQLMPGSTGQLSLSFNSISQSLVKNPNINVKVTMTGDRSGIDSSVISSTEELLVKIASNISITSKLWRNLGPFSNSGPIPPKADSETTYTATWTLTNTANDLKSTKVSATLPPGVSWKGEVSPVSQKVTYNPDNRTITWEVGNLSYGVGFVYSPREVSFKLGLTPSLNQVGSTPMILSESTVTAFDSYAEVNISSITNQLNTVFSDPNYKNNDGVVVQ